MSSECSNSTLESSSFPPSPSPPPSPSSPAPFFSSPVPSSTSLPQKEQKEKEFIDLSSISGVSGLEQMETESPSPPPEVIIEESKEEEEEPEIEIPPPPSSSSSSLNRTKKETEEPVVKPEPGSQQDIEETKGKKSFIDLTKIESLSSSFAPQTAAFNIAPIELEPEGSAREAEQEQETLGKEEEINQAQRESEALLKQQQEQLRNLQESIRRRKEETQKKRDEEQEQERQERLARQKAREERDQEILREMEEENEQRESSRNRRAKQQTARRRESETKAKARTAAAFAASSSSFSSSSSSSSSFVPPSSYVPPAQSMHDLGSSGSGFFGSRTKEQSEKLQQSEPFQARNAYSKQCSVSFSARGFKNQSILFSNKSNNTQLTFDNLAVQLVATENMKLDTRKNKNKEVLQKQGIAPPLDMDFWFPFQFNSIADCSTLQSQLVPLYNKCLTTPNGNAYFLQCYHDVVSEKIQECVCENPLTKCSCRVIVKQIPLVLQTGKESNQNGVEFQELRATYAATCLLPYIPYYDLLLDWTGCYNNRPQAEEISSGEKTEVTSQENELDSQMLTCGDELATERYAKKKAPPKNPSFAIQYLVTRANPITLPELVGSFLGPKETELSRQQSMRILLTQMMCALHGLLASYKMSHGLAHQWPNWNVEFDPTYSKPSSPEYDVLTLIPGKYITDEFVPYLKQKQRKTQFDEEYEEIGRRIVAIQKMHTFYIPRRAWRIKLTNFEEAESSVLFKNKTEKRSRFFIEQDVLQLMITIWNFEIQVARQQQGKHLFDSTSSGIFLEDVFGGVENLQRLAEQKVLNDNNRVPEANPWNLLVFSNYFQQFRRKPPVLSNQQFHFLEPMTNPEYLEALVVEK